jgi:sec-independent protein translocase protein TatA
VIPNITTDPSLPQQQARATTTKRQPIMQLSTNLLFINLGVPELSIIVVLVLILFGPGKLPHVMKSLGDGVKHFKDAATGSNTETKTEDSGKTEQ